MKQVVGDFDISHSVCGRLSLPISAGCPLLSNGLSFSPQGILNTFFPLHFAELPLAFLFMSYSSLWDIPSLKLLLGTGRLTSVELQ